MQIRAQHLRHVFLRGILCTNDPMHAQHLRHNFPRDEIAEDAIIICLVENRPTSRETGSKMLGWLSEDNCYSSLCSGGINHPENNI